MAETAIGRAAAPTPSTTVSETFFTCGNSGQPLFAVREGLPAMDVLEEVSTLLDAAKDAAEISASEAEGGISGTMWACVYVLTMAKSALDGVVSGMARVADHGAVSKGVSHG